MIINLLQVDFHIVPIILFTMCLVSVFSLWSFYLPDVFLCFDLLQITCILINAMNFVCNDMMHININTRYHSPKEKMNVIEKIVWFSQCFIFTEDALAHRWKYSSINGKSLNYD